MALKAVLFDIGETLWHDAERIPDAEFERLGRLRTGELLRAWGRTDDPSFVASHVWAALGMAMAQAAGGDLVEPDYPARVRDQLRPLGLDFTSMEVGSLLDAAYVSGREAGKRPYPGAADVLHELRRRGFRLAALTNRAFGGERFRRDLKDAGLDVGWDVEAVSCEVGYLKPHPRIFEWALARLDLEPGCALMVGNSLAQDVAGAQRLGMPAAWKRCHPDAEGVTPEYTFDALPELLDFPVLRCAG